jgi:trk system potassium uptake protein TrkH
VLIFLFVLLAVEAGNSALIELPRRFLAILFEVLSAFGTVGLSMGVTKILSPAGLLLLSALMFIGRLGPLTLALAVTHRPLPKVRHPEERLMVG